MNKKIIKNPNSKFRKGKRAIKINVKFETKRDFTKSENLK